jgi:hypothetical protein|tara:strand:- start:1720 stop:3588 length:1869 start_codon:yes stop_codon:yes gene_type:complete
VQDLTHLIKGDYSIGNEILHRPFDEFNGLSLVERMNKDQTTWLNWNPDRETNPESSWQFLGVRPTTRNRVISTAAHLTSQVVVPMVHAQNDQDEEDREAAYVMRDLLEYNVQHSNYELAFLYGVVSALVNPITYFKVGYSYATQDIWEKGKLKKVEDDVLSGFQFFLIPADEILIGNPYEFDLQKQPFLIHRRFITFESARGLWGDYKNWEYITPGIKAIYNQEDGLFYDVEDDNQNLIEEVTYYCRRKDTEVVFINGVYFGDEAMQNPMTHRTNKGKPRYPFAKGGAEPIDAMRFFAYKSLVAKMQNDQEGLDRAWQMYHDANFLATYPPVVTIGAGKMDKSVIIPASTTDLKPNAKVEPLNMVNPQHMQASLVEFEKSLSDSSQDPQLGGKSGEIPRTARQSILIQQNAQINLGITGKMIGSIVKEVGSLMLDDILRYQTPGQVSEILGGVTKLKYKSFILPNKTVDGKNTTEIVRFKDNMLGMELTEEEKERKELGLFKEAGDTRALYDVNPANFAKLDYLVSVDYEQMMQRNSNFEKALKLETYDRAITNPLIINDPEKAALLTRDFLLEPLVGGDAEKYVPDVQQNMQNAAQQLSPNGLPARIVQGAAKEAGRELAV